MNNTQNVSVKGTPTTKKIASLDKKKAKAGWYFVLPFAIGFIILYLPMLFTSIEFSFSDIEILRTGGYTLENYKNA